MHFGHKPYAEPDHDADKERAKEKALWNRTPEQVYEDAYAYWMRKYGEYNKRS
jgi:hypothetical protein